MGIRRRKDLTLICEEGITPAQKKQIETLPCNRQYELSFRISSEEIKKIGGIIVNGAEGIVEYGATWVGATKNRIIGWVYKQLNLTKGRETISISRYVPSSSFPP